jgi:transposase
MPRSLTIRKPLPAEIRQLHHLLAKPLPARQQRRVEAILFYAAELEASEIAQTLGVHVNTVYADLRAFEQEGVASIHSQQRGGAPGRIPEAQRAEIRRLAELSPGDVGVPYGRWSLAKLRSYLLKHRVVKAISREHLRRLLKEGGCDFATLHASWSVTIRGDGPFWPGFA